ncbi:hypothetical protein KOI40_00560 [Aestuariicella sp. G3-2]|uniref:hypothetical protein n=1 Tax=Pseudomaricurvus albidus TaxID=2842452 RepID=UPI001C0AF62E|nr:hypothetical protein [Aestuariicella albida]MBU3068284.1 hypothetical protein [Aestuariicella albida]
MSDVSEDLHGLLFGIQRSVRYHSRREQFFDRFNTFVTVLNLILGSATILTFAAEFAKDWALWAKLLPAAAVTVLSSIDLVIGSARMARTHNDLAREFIVLEKEVRTSKVSELTEEDIANFTGRRLDIEMKEPPVKLVLDSICHNELLKASGYDAAEYLKIGRLQAFFAQLIDITPSSITKAVSAT